MRLHLDPDGLWCGPAAAGPPRPALFLDRDGVLVAEPGYLHRAADVLLLPGAAALVGRARRRGWAAVAVTNQSGIGRGRYGWQDFAETQAEIERRLAVEGEALDLVLACPFHAEGRGRYRVADHPGRKPRPGMLLRAAERLGLDLARSWLAGDQASDVAAARAAGLAGAIHLATGHGSRPGERDKALALAAPRFRVLAAADAAAAAAMLPA